MFGKKIVNGLDLGAHTLKCAVVETDTGCVRELWKSDILPDRQSRDQTLTGEALSQRLAILLNLCHKECTTFKANVVTAIQGEGTVCRYLEFPPLSDPELKIAVPAEVKKFLAFPIAQTSLSYFQVPLISSGKKGGVFVVAARKDSVEEMKILLEQCNLQVQRIETPVLALVREFVKNHDNLRNRFHVLVHVGFRLTQIVILRNGYPYFAREFSMGGRDFTYAFQMRTQSSWSEAEQYKLHYDVMSKEASIEPFLIRWLDEVKKSLSFFCRQFAKEFNDICKVCLSGATAQWTNLDKRLGEHLNLPVIVDDWNRVKPINKGRNLKEKSLIYKVAVGLALED